MSSKANYLVVYPNDDGRLEMEFHKTEKSAREAAETCAECGGGEVSLYSLLDVATAAGVVWRGKPKPNGKQRRTRGGWSADQDAFILTQRANGVSHVDIGRKLNRTPSAVANRYSRIRTRPATI